MIEEITKISTQHLHTNSLNNTIKFISKIWLTTLFVHVQYLIPFVFFFIFSKFIRFCMSKIWMDKRRVLNNYLFYFQLKTIKLALQLYLYFISFAIINNFFYVWTDFGTFWYVLKKTKKFSERNSINTLFLKCKVWKAILQP